MPCRSGGGSCSWHGASWGDLPACPSACVALASLANNHGAIPCPRKGTSPLYCRRTAEMVAGLLRYCWCKAEPREEAQLALLSIADHSLSNCQILPVPFGETAKRDDLLSISKRSSLPILLYQKAVQGEKEITRRSSVSWWSFHGSKPK